MTREDYVKEFCQALWENWADSVKDRIALPKEVEWVRLPCLSTLDPRKLS